VQPPCQAARRRDATMCRFPIAVLKLSMRKSAAGCRIFGTHPKRLTGPYAISL
jgi:hypothetical protein